MLRSVCDGIDPHITDMYETLVKLVAADGSKAKLRKSSVVRVPRSVYSAVPGRNKFRPSQVTPIDNFVLAGDFTSQKFLGSMEGAVLAGKLAVLRASADVVEQVLVPDTIISSLS